MSSAASLPLLIVSCPLVRVRARTISVQRSADCLLQMCSAADATDTTDAAFDAAATAQRLRPCNRLPPIGQPDTTDERVPALLPVSNHRLHNPFGRPPSASYFPRTARLRNHSTALRQPSPQPRSLRSLLLSGTTAARAEREAKALFLRSPAANVAVNAAFTLCYAGCSVGMLICWYAGM